MNDDQLKNILNQDNSMPKAPVNEWSTINSRINSQAQQNSWFLGFNTSKLTIVFSFLLIGLIGMSSWQYRNLAQATEHESLSEYFLEDDYFSEEPSLYTWVDINR